MATSRTRKAIRLRHVRYSSQMHSSHHNGEGKGVAEEEKECVLTRNGGCERPFCQLVDRGRVCRLPPSSGAQPPGVHLAHVAHANEANREVFHPRRDGRGRVVGHGARVCETELRFRCRKSHPVAERAASRTVTARLPLPTLCQERWKVGSGGGGGWRKENKISSSNAKNLRPSGETHFGTSGQSPAALFLQGIEPHQSLSGACTVPPP